MKKLMSAVAVAAIACGCVTANKNDGGNSSLKPVVVKDGLHLKYEVGKERVKGADTLNCLFGFITWGSTATHVCDQSEFSFGGKGKVKNGAYANACDAAKCDQLVGARYTITANKDWFVFQHYEAEVTGFPASVKGVEVIDGVKNPIGCAPKAGGCPGLPF